MNSPVLFMFDDNTFHIEWIDAGLQYKYNNDVARAIINCISRKIQDRDKPEMVLCVCDTALMGHFFDTMRNLFHCRSKHGVTYLLGAGQEEMTELVHEFLIECDDDMVDPLFCKMSLEGVNWYDEGL
jgi:hypothetical protein